MNKLNNLQVPRQKTDANGRRRFVRGVGAVVPVTLTISAKSAMACHCTSVSANSSIKIANSHNATGDDNSTIDCRGKFPATWAGLTVTGSDTLFSTIFSPVGTTKQNKTMKEIAGWGNSNRYAIFAAAYLNVLNGSVSDRYYTTAHLQAMWPVVYNQSGSYVPTPGAQWSSSDIISYLTQTFGY